MVSGLGSSLSFCPVFPQWRTITWKYKPKKPRHESAGITYVHCCGPVYVGSRNAYSGSHIRVARAYPLNSLFGSHIPLILGEFPSCLWNTALWGIGLWMSWWGWLLTEMYGRANEVSVTVKMLPAKPEALSFILWSHMVEQKNQLL